MTVTENVAALARELRRITDNMLNLPDVELARAWANAWDAVEADMVEALEELATGAGRIPAWKIQRNQRITAALNALKESMEDALSSFTSTLADVTTPALLEQTRSWGENMVRAQLPIGAAIGYAFTQPDKAAIEAIVKRTTERIVSPLLDLPAEVDALMKRGLVRGIIVGDNPNRTARRIIRDTQRQFVGGYNRASMIARTEMHDAQRAAAQTYEKANADIIAGWVWVAALDKRTCRSCIAMHGSIHKSTEQLIDHHRGRCIRAPLVRPLKELGIKGVADNEKLIQTGEEWFAQLPRPEKLSVLSGGAKHSIGAEQALKHLEAGDLKFSDLTTVKHNNGWRASRHATSFEDLEKKAAANAYTRNTRRHH